MPLGVRFYALEWAQFFFYFCCLIISPPNRHRSVCNYVSVTQSHDTFWQTFSHTRHRFSHVVGLLPVVFRRRIGGFSFSCRKERPVWSCVPCCGNMTNHQIKKALAHASLNGTDLVNAKARLLLFFVLLLNRDVIRSSVYLERPVGALSSSSLSISLLPLSFSLSHNKTA